jgi:ribosomal protein L44E
MSYKNCELCGNKIPYTLAQYCHTCNEHVLEQLRLENKRLRDALEATK